MAGNEFIEGFLQFCIQEDKANEHERRQRRLALAYASARNEPPPSFPLERPLPEEIEPIPTCPSCGYPLG